MNRRWKPGGGFLFALLLFLSTVTAVHPPPAGAAPPDKEDGITAQIPSKKTKVPEDPRRALQMQEIEILGEVEKPKTMFVIPRAPHAYFWEQNKKDFTEEILSPINKQEIEDTQRWRKATSLP